MEIAFPIPSRVLVVSAHPDDVDFGCAGTVALWTKAGSQVSYIICTGGDKGSDDTSIEAEALAKIREEEQKEAARLLGVAEVHFLGFQDGALENDVNLRKALVRWIRKMRPQVILCHDPANRSFENPYVSHRDHRELSEAVFDAVYPASGNPHFFPELMKENLVPHKVEEMIFFGTHSPNFWQDITEVMELKIKAILSHKSQIKDPEQMEKFLKVRFGEVGKRFGVAYAEPFRRLTIPW